MMSERSIWRGVLTDFLDIGEVGVDVTEIRPVGRQEEDVVAIFAGDGLKVFLFVEGSVILNKCGIRTQFLARHAPCPVVDKSGIGRAREQHRRENVFAAPAAIRLVRGRRWPEWSPKTFCPRKLQPWRRQTSGSKPHSSI